MMGDKTGTCWFDDVKLQNLGAGGSSSSGGQCVKDSGSLLSDGTFTLGTKCLTKEIHDSATATITADYSTYGNAAPSIKVQNNKTQYDYQVQLTYINLPITKGNKYRITYKAWCSASRNVLANIQKGAHDWRNYGLYKHQWVGTSKATFTHDFTATETASDAKLGFAVGDKTGSCWFDDVKLQDLGK